MKFMALPACAQAQDSGFELRRGMVDAQIVTASAKGIADTTLFVRGQNDKRYCLGLDHPELGYRQLPYAEQFEQHGLKCRIDLVQLVDQEHATPPVLQGSQQGAGGEEFKAMQFLLELLPFDRPGPRLQFHGQPLQGFIEPANRLLLINALETLQALDLGLDGPGDGIGELGFAAAWRPFNEDGLVQPGGQVYHRGSYLISDVAGRSQSLERFLCRGKQRLLLLVPTSATVIGTQRR